jgi:hypothetical protein
MDELAGQHAAELPRRDLLIGLTLLFIPIASVSGVAVNVAGPRFLA